MRNKKLNLCLTIILVFGLSGLKAQVAITAAGSDTVQVGGSVSYSVGQIAYQFSSDANGSLQEGVHQPLEISEVTSKAENLSKTQVLIYPNPAMDKSTLRLEGKGSSVYHYQIFDIHGKLLSNKEIAGDRIDIPLHRLNPSVYILKILQDKQEIKVYKILKK